MKIYVACTIKLMYLLFICSGISLVGALIEKILMIQRVASMLITWETSEDHRKSLNTRLKIAFTCRSRMVKTILGSYALMAYFVKSVIPPSRSSTILNNTRGKTVIAKGVISKRYVLSIMAPKKKIRHWRTLRNIGNQFKESNMT